MYCSYRSMLSALFCYNSTLALSRFLGRTVFPLVLVGVTVLSLTGCGGGTDTSEEGGGHTGEAAHGETLGEGHEKVEHVAEKDLPSVMKNAKTFTIMASDGTDIVGKFYHPNDKDYNPDPVGTKYPIAILIHSLNGSKEDWKTFPSTMVDEGYAVFAMDIRGHGESIKKQGSGQIAWRNFDARDWQRVPRDIGNVIKYFREEIKKEKIIDTSDAMVVLIGSGLGGNAALDLAAKNAQELNIDAVVMLSPLEEVKTLSTEDLLLDYTRPLFLAASQEDTNSFDTAKLLYRIHGGKKSIRLFKNVGHGTEMMQNYEDLGKDIIEWLDKLGIREHRGVYNRRAHKNHGLDLGIDKDDEYLNPDIVIPVD